MAYDIPFVSDYMRSMGVGGAYPKVTVDVRHRFLMILHLCCSLSLVLQLRIEASKHVTNLWVFAHAHAMLIRLSFTTITHA